jgi:PI-3-kinase-related kinase SMG-1
VAWKRLIPQLFSRLNHPDSVVRDYVTNLLIRVAKDFPQLILYSVIVGITDDSKMRRMKSRDENVYIRKSLSIHGSDDEPSQVNTEEEDDEEEETEDVEDEDDDVEKQESVLAMQNSFRVLYNVLSETNAHVVGQVKLFVHELRRVTVLWDELWLGTMAQLQEEISRLVSDQAESKYFQLLRFWVFRCSKKIRRFFFLRGFLKTWFLRKNLQNRPYFSDTVHPIELKFFFTSTR